MLILMALLVHMCMVECVRVFMQGINAVQMKWKKDVQLNS